MSGGTDKGALFRSTVSLISVYWHEWSPLPRLRPGTLLSLGYYVALFIIMDGLYPCAMSKETASLVSVNTAHADTQQPRNLINKQGFCNKRVSYYCCIQRTEIRAGIQDVTCNNFKKMWNWNLYI